MKNCGCVMSKIGKVLLVIGGLNWGLVGIGMFMGSNLNVVNMIVGSWPKLEALIYVLVGIAAIMKMIGCKCAKCKACMAGGMDSGAPKM